MNRLIVDVMLAVAVGLGLAVGNPDIAEVGANLQQSGNVALESAADIGTQLRAEFGFMANSEASTATEDVEAGAALEAGASVEDTDAAVNAELAAEAEASAEDGEDEEGLLGIFGLGDLDLGLGLGD